jgi:hypothetical protein
MVLSFYDVLGVAPDATIEQIKSAFHSLALRSHPDKVGSAGQSSHEGFMQAQRAWEVGFDVKICWPAGTCWPAPVVCMHKCVSELVYGASNQVLRNPGLREMHDRELALQHMRQTLSFQDELELTDMEVAEMEGEGCSL